MEIKEVQEKIEFAIKAVKDVPEPFKVKAFEIVLNKSLSEQTSHNVASVNEPKLEL